MSKLIITGATGTGLASRSLDTILGPLFINTSKGVSAGILGSFLVEASKGSLANVSLANNAHLKELSKPSP